MGAELIYDLSKDTQPFVAFETAIKRIRQKITPLTPIDYFLESDMWLTLPSCLIPR